VLLDLIKAPCVTIDRCAKRRDFGLKAAKLAPDANESLGDVEQALSQEWDRARAMGRLP